MEDVRCVAALSLPWDKLRDKSLLLSGATGLIGSFLVDVILEKNATDDLNCTVYALSRNEEKAKVRFIKYMQDERLVFVPYDVRFPFVRDDIGMVEYVLHLASNTHPLQYSTDPIGTITTNIVGVQNMLDFSVEHHAARFAFASSNEIYGENRGDVEFFEELADALPDSSLEDDWIFESASFELETRSKSASALDKAKLHLTELLPSESSLREISS